MQNGFANRNPDPYVFMSHKLVYVAKDHAFIRLLILPCGEH